MRRYVHDCVGVVLLLVVVDDDGGGGAMTRLPDVSSKGVPQPHPRCALAARLRLCVVLWRKPPNRSCICRFVNAGSIKNVYRSECVRNAHRSVSATPAPPTCSGRRVRASARGDPVDAHSMHERRLHVLSALTILFRPARGLVAMSPPGKTLPQVLGTIDNSLKTALKADPNSDKLHPNKEPREVFGQYVEVTPTPLPVR